MPITVALPN